MEREVKGKTFYLIREARVEYVDLCFHTNVSREEFFQESSLKRLSCYGLVLESDDLIKVLWCDDTDDNEECEGIVIPRACVIAIHYFSGDDLPSIDPIDREKN